MAAYRIRVLSVDDHVIFREGIALVVDRQPDMHVIASTASGEKCIQLYKRLRPDITLMDLQLGDTSGLDAIHRLRVLDPSARIIVLTVLRGDEDIFRALEAGAATYLLKNIQSADLIRAIREVHAGQRPLRQDIKERLAERASRSRLTAREIQIVELIYQGMRNKEVAATLGISYKTTEVHVRHILAKLAVQDRTAAVRVALRRGIIHVK